jgi:hypothetical protein
VKTSAVFRGPVAGLFLLGLVFGGLPSAVVLSRLGGRIVSPEFLKFLLFLALLWVLVSTTVAALGPNETLKRVFIKALVTSLGSCFLVPMIVSLVLAWPMDGGDALSPANLGALLVILFTFVLAVIVASCLLAFTYRSVTRHLRGETI